MKYVCVKTCQIRIGKQIHHVHKGEIKELDAPNQCFQCLEDSGYTVDFLKASKEELMTARWKFTAAASALGAVYSTALKKYDGDRKIDIVERIMDIRYRGNADVPANLPLGSEPGVTT